MNLYLIETARALYATNARNLDDAENKFKLEYPHYYIDVAQIKKIPVESLVTMEDNDSIVFF